MLWRFSGTWRQQGRATVAPVGRLWQEPDEIGPSIDRGGRSATSICNCVFSNVRLARKCARSRLYASLSDLTNGNGLGLVKACSSSMVGQISAVAPVARPAAEGTRR